MLTAMLSSCTTLSYYQQSVSGQLALLAARRDLNTVLQSADTPALLKIRLRRIAKIRDFASEVVGLPDNNSYRSYADIGRKYIVWNVFATPALSFKPYQSCFFIIGCLGYRGFFKKKDAIAYRNSMQARGFDVYLGGVAAYSTLGWFDDPILNGMLDRNDTDLARLIFHELAHQQLYLRDDTEFNESFADAVAQIGVENWLEARGTALQRREFQDQLQREDQFNDLILTYEDKLQRLFDANSPAAWKLRQKSLLYRDLQRAYGKLRAGWGDHNDYDNWMRYKLNNAKLAAISTYRKLVPLFLHAYAAAGKDMQAFFDRVKKISACRAGRRRQLLHSIAPVAAC